MPPRPPAVTPGVARVSVPPRGPGARARRSLRRVSAWVRRLLVVDDEALVRALLSEALTNAGFDVRTAVNAAEARVAVDEFDPDVAVIDIHLGAGPSGLHLGHALHRGHPDIGLVFLTKYHDRHAGGVDAWDVPPGSAFLAKDRIDDTRSLTAAIESVLRGASPPDDRSSGPLSALTPTQVEILRLAALGLTNSAIAKTRKTQERTVEQRLQAIYAALGIPVTGDHNPRVEAVRRYIQAAGMPVDDRHALTR